MRNRNDPSPLGGPPRRRPPCRPTTTGNRRRPDSRRTRQGHTVGRRRLPAHPDDGTDQNLSRPRRPCPRTAPTSASSHADVQPVPPSSGPAPGEPSHRYGPPASRRLVGAGHRPPPRRPTHHRDSHMLPGQTLQHPHILSHFRPPPRSCPSYRHRPAEHAASRTACRTVWKPSARLPRRQPLQDHAGPRRTHRTPSGRLLAPWCPSQETGAVDAVHRIRRPDHRVGPVAGLVGEGRTHRRGVVVELGEGADSGEQSDGPDH